MKKSMTRRESTEPQKLSFRPETIRILTEQQLTLVAAGNCLNASMYSQNSTAGQFGTC